MSLIETSGVIKKPKIITVFGVESVGKTEFMTKFPKTYFVDFEGASRRYKVSRILPSEKDYFAVKEFLTTTVYEKMQNHQTLAIDSLDWLERAMIKGLCDRAKVTTVQDLGGYGKWVDVINTEWASLINLLKDFVEKTGKDLVMSAHFEVKKFDDPVTAVPYDRYVMKLYPKHSALIREWSEAVLFANFETHAKAKSASDTKGKGIGFGVRKLYTEKRPAHDGKNRYSLPYEIPMDYDTLMSFVDASDEDLIKGLQQDIEALMIDVKDAEMNKKSKEFYEDNKENLEKLKAIKQRLSIIIDSQE